MAEEQEEKNIPTHEEVKSDNNETVREEGKEKSLPPWEQHFAVISIPRFDYNAPSALRRNSHSGFLVTCTIKREKSATKEAISILQKYIGFSSGCTSESFEEAKRRKMCGQSEDVRRLDDREIGGGKGSNETRGTSTVADTITDTSPVLSLVKLTRSGLVLFTFPPDIPSDTVNTVSNIILSLESKSFKSPLWCHRIFPIQATCSSIEKDLHSVVSKLVLQFLNDDRNKLARPIKFAVGYNRRGIEETEMKTCREGTNGTDAKTMLDRNKCFSVVAAAVKDVASDSLVDLKSPQVCVLVELLPLSGLPRGPLVLGVSVLPRHLVKYKAKIMHQASSFFFCYQTRDLKRAMMMLSLSSAFAHFALLCCFCFKFCIFFSLYNP